MGRNLESFLVNVLVPAALHSLSPSSEKQVAKLAAGRMQLHKGEPNPW